MSEKFEFLSKLGEGSFASVYKVKRKEDSSIYAFKKMKSVNMGDRETLSFLNEIRILASLNSPYIIGYKEAFFDEGLKCFCLVTEFAEGGDLSAKISRARKIKEHIPESYIWKVALQLLHGINTLHHLNVFHRDIKPANILLTKNESALLADMNVSVIAKTGLACTQTGTPYYSSPEVWLETPYNGKSDIWSFGCVLYEMATLKTPFQASDLHELKKKVIESEIEPIPSIYSKELRTLIHMCLEKDKKKRPSAKELLNLPIVKEQGRKLSNEKFNELHLPNIEKGQMIETIRIGYGTSKFNKVKLPKCNYESCDKENINDNLNTKRINKNLSCVSKIVEKLPSIKRSGSSSKMEENCVRKDIFRKLRC